MKPLVVVNPPRAAPEAVDALAELGVATVHEALGRSLLLGTHLRPLWPGARMAGTAVTVLCWPGDNLMVHVAVEQAKPGTKFEIDVRGKRVAAEAVAMPFVPHRTKK